MDDGRLLIEAIKNQPREATPRLMYADWLQENGEGERAELIRLSTAELAGGDDVGTDRADRIRQIVEAHKAAWVKPPLDPGYTEFYAGFPFVHLHLENYHSTDDFVHRTEELLRTNPDVTGMNIADNRVSWGGGMGPAVRSSLLGHLNRLTLSGDNHLPDDVIADLARNPAVARLTHLALPNTGMSDVGAAALARSPQLRGLTSLVVRSRDLTAEGFATLSSGTYHDSLEHLGLHYCYLGDDALRALAERGPPLPSLKTLSLVGTGATRDGLAALAASPRWPKTTVLSFLGTARVTFSGTIDELRTTLGSGRGDGRGSGWNR